MARQGVPIMAELRSVLNGQNHLQETRPKIRGTVADLERGKTAAGPVVNALADELAALFDYTEAELASVHLAQAPIEQTLDLTTLAQALGSPNNRWRPEQLPALLNSVPAQSPLAIYGRAPNWVYAALALHARPAPVCLFDVRLGWVFPPTLPVIERERVTTDKQSGRETAIYERPEFSLIEITTRSQYLDIETPQSLPLPNSPAGKGLVLSGKLPHWLLLAAARQLISGAPWLAVYHPPSGGAVVVHSDEETYDVGQVISFSHP
jgi:CRISPR-associated protein Csx3